MASSDSSASKAAYSTDPALYIYTSLTAGSSHIVTATSRLETILRANKVPFKAIDIATDEKARMLWGRRAGKDESGRVRKLPGLVQTGLVLGDLVEIEDWNEYGELKQHVTMYYDEFTQPPISQAPKPAPAPKKPAPAPAAPPPPQEKPKPAAAPAPKAEGGPPGAGASKALPIRSIAEEAAAKAKQVHLQSLRDKVYGKGNTGPDSAGGSDGKKEEDTAKKEAEKAKPEEDSDEDEEEDDEDDEDEEDEDDDDDDDSDDDDDDDSDDDDNVEAAPKKPTAIAVPSPSTSSSKAAAATVPVGGDDLQSPTSGAWRGGDGAAAEDALLRATLQSPVSTSWKPTDVDPPVTSHRGSLISRASQEEIEKIEREQALIEQPVEEEEAEAEEERERQEKSKKSKDGGKGKATKEKKATKDKSSKDKSSKEKSSKDKSSKEKSSKEKSSKEKSSKGKAGKAKATK